MDTFAAIADERRELAVLVSDLTDTQLRTPSLCRGWTVHDVVAHLVVPLAVGVPRFGVAMALARGNFDRANVAMTRRQARRPAAELAGVLRDRAESRFTPPGSGPEAPLTDLLVHGLDIRRPLALARSIPAERLRIALDFLARGPAGFVRRGALDDLRLLADDLDWSHGAGPPVRGPAESLLLAVTGRDVGLAEVGGAGREVLRDRLSAGR